MMIQEREALDRKQAWYQHVPPSDVDKETEYLTFCSDTKLRLHVAELRLDRLCLIIMILLLLCVVNINLRKKTAANTVPTLMVNCSHIHTSKTTEIS